MRGEGFPVYVGFKRWVSKIILREIGKLQGLRKLLFRKKKRLKGVLQPNGNQVQFSDLS
jgi:recombinational DNA repair protein (RecF pathway)